MNAGPAQTVPHPYAGDLSAADAWKRLQGTDDVLLVDVRTPAEWSTVGAPNLTDLGRSPLFLSWRTQPGYALNERFVADLKDELADAGPDTPILFLCKSGGRSAEAAAAMTAEGFTQCYNVAGGFEGAGGWKAEGLPWALA